MIPSDDDIKRQVIPRWRTIRATTEAGELGSSERQTPSEALTALSSRLVQELHLRVREWREEKDLAAAEELLAAAIVAGDDEFKAEIAAASQLVLADPASLPGSIELARSFAQDAAVAEEPLPTETKKMYSEIARRKRLLRVYPRDPLLFTETALLYTNLGLNNSAKQLLRAAAALAPNNRYVLRSLTRFWVHQAEPDRALHFLSRSAATKYDPWLLAAQVATEDVAQKKSINWREAKRVLDDDRFSDFELTELAAALATLQLQAGSHKLARKMFRKSLAKPTENSVAQVQWASRRDPTISVSHDLTANASEALAWEQLSAHQWNEVIGATRRWQEIEPFSVRPAVMGSFVGVGHLGDGRVGEQFARRGLVANKGSQVLHNNLAVSLALQGRVPEARAELENVKPAPGTNEEIVNLATRGLIEMRAGDVAGGADLYRRSIELAVTLRSAALWCRAYAHFAVEVARFDKSALPEVTTAIMKVYDKLPDQAKLILNDVPAMLERAARLQTVADVLVSLENFRERFIPTYPSDGEAQ
ncbi:Tfp pilus assembly protein PilF [Bradyrhizobium japonicum]|uniref:Tfp pilus assembly protein PilF n=1 Tax=Bradyrhizobium japonicum TaxID=375 RepID=A0ABV2RJN9_BRAJP